MKACISKNDQERGCISIIHPKLDLVCRYNTWIFSIHRRLHFSQIDRRSEL